MRKKSHLSTQRMQDERNKKLRGKFYKVWGGGKKKRDMSVAKRILRGSRGKGKEDGTTSDRMEGGKALGIELNQSTDQKVGLGKKGERK